jgi:Mg2+/Co2+ transporter CorB
MARFQGNRSTARTLGDASVGVVSGALAVLLLVASEIVPKTLAAAHAARLASPVGHSLFHLLRGMAPLLVLTRALTGWLTRGASSRLTRRELATLITTAPQEGAISASESELLAHLIYVDAVSLHEVTTAAAAVFMLNADDRIADLLAAPRADAFSRIPLFRGQRGNVVGCVSNREVLKAYARTLDPSIPLRRFLRPLPSLVRTLPVRKAVEHLLDAHETVALVVDERGATIGLVTLEDLLERFSASRSLTSPRASAVCAGRPTRPDDGERNVCGAGGRSGTRASVCRRRARSRPTRADPRREPERAAILRPGGSSGEAQEVSSFRAPSAPAWWLTAPEGGRSR